MDDKTHIKELEQIKNEINVLFKKKKFINPQIADDLILIAQQKVKRYLTNLFDNGFSDLIAKDDYHQFILYSYKSYYGEIPAQTSENNHIFKRRLNLYKRGKRWSDNTGSRFYSFLDRINEIFGDIPINILGDLCAKYSVNHIVIQTTDNPVASNGKILFPSRDILKDIRTNDGKAMSGLLNNYIQLLTKKSNSTMFSTIESDVEKYNISELIEIASRNEDIILFLDGIKNYFSIEDDDFVLYKERLIKSFFAYQFNDLDFDLHLFFPSSDKFLSTLMVALPVGSNSILDIQDTLLTITESLSFLERFEKNVVKKTKDNNDTYIMWKNIYEREYDKLYTFMKSIENICYSLCKQNNIGFSHMSARVKTFESFYNKIYYRANSPEENKKLKKLINISYSDAIKKPHLYYRKLFMIIKDLAGIRIVLLFEDDLKKIVNLFNKLHSDEDINLKGIKFYKQCVEDEESDIPPDDKTDIYNYRSLHITVMPGTKRINLIEYQNLFNVQCEIQFRSVLAHAWADVNHNLDYKHREVIKEVLPSSRNKLKDLFSTLSKNLYANDKFLNKIKKEASKMKIDFE